MTMPADSSPENFQVPREEIRKTETLGRSMRIIEWFRDETQQVKRRVVLITSGENKQRRSVIYAIGSDTQYSIGR